MSKTHQIDQRTELEQAHPKHDCHCHGKCRNCKCRAEAEFNKDT